MANVAIHSEDSPHLPAQPVHGLRTAGTILGRLIAALALTFALDAAIFRSGWYSRLLEPASSTASYERMLRQELTEQKPGEQRVLVVGNSRVGFLARAADEYAAGRNVRFGNLALGGTTPRTWYYLLRDVDPKASAYRAVMVPVETYEDEETSGDERDRLADLAYIAARLRLTDVPEFTASFASPEMRWEAFRASLWKCFFFKRDLQAFLNSPRKRIEAVRDRADWHEWVYRFHAGAESLEGMQIDWEKKELRVPRDLTGPQMESIHNVLMGDPLEPTGWMQAYRRQWLGHIIDHYRESKTRVILYRLPRGPLLRPESWKRAKTNTAEELAKRPAISLADPLYFEELERPRYYVDALHLNGPGMELFSRKLADLALRQD